ncbi:MAG TPA: hypothetical protein VLL52_20175, partial [Anaerolineae bacterium]|nr:hypothetical protein [Anaerolineae bacterium]
MKRWVAIICLVGMGMFLSLWWAGQQLVVRANSVMTVDMVADEVDLTPGDGLCLTASGGCSLRAAIQEANVLSGTDTVVVPAGVYLLSLDGEEGDSVAGDLNIKDDLILLGAGIDETIVTGNGGDRLWQVGVDVVVTVQDMSWQGGNATLLASPNGGGVKNQGDLRLINVIVANSQGVCGGGIYNSGQLTLAYTKVVTNSATGNGGGICNMGVLTATDTLLAYNESLVDLLGGGGLYSSHVVRMARSLVTHNVALFGNGGGLAIENGSLWLDQSWIYHNEAEVLGGGIVGGTSWLTITNSTIAANTVWGETGTAGGIGQFGGEVLMVNSSVSGNRADVGGGLFSVGDIEMAYVTVVDNVADTAIGGMVFNGTMSVVRSSVVGNNVGGNCDGVLVSGGYNVSSDWG